jgi:hypothetical protein
LIRGNKYILDFYAWSSQSRYLDVKLAESVSPFVDYSQIASPFLTPNRAHYRYTFIMQQPSDYSAILQFNLGASTADVYLDDITLYNPAVGDLNMDGRVDYSDLNIFSSSWLKQQPGLPSDLDSSGKVDFNDLNLLGGNWSVTGP